MPTGNNTNHVVSDGEVALVIKGSTDDVSAQNTAGHYDQDTSDETVGVIMIDTWEYSSTQEENIISGGGNVEPKVRTKSNKRYSFSFTLYGYSANLFTDLADETKDLEIHIQFYDEDDDSTNEWILTGIDYNDFTMSGGDEEEVSCEFETSAMGVDEVGDTPQLP